MRRLVLSLVLATVPIAGAYAADMPLKAPPVPYASYSWTGLYLGGQVGDGWATSQTTDIDATTSFAAGTLANPIDFRGPLGGIYGGYNYQMNNIVLGIAGSYSFADLTGTGSDPSNQGPQPRTTTHSDRIKSIATVTGRLGYASSNWMLFAAGGWAWADFSGTSVTTRNDTGATTSTGSFTSDRNGWTVGVGGEYGITPHLSAKLEYDYIKFATANFTATDVSAAGVITTPARSATSSLNMILFGLGYRF